MSFWKTVIIDWLSNVFLLILKNNYEVSTPISLKANNKTPNHFIVHLHICVFSTCKQTYIYTVVY